MEVYAHVLSNIPYKYHNYSSQTNGSAIVDEQVPSEWHKIVIKSDLNIMTQRKNCTASVSDSARRKVNHIPTNDPFHGNVKLKKLLNKLDILLRSLVSRLVMT